MSRHFVFASHGWSASNWVAHALHLHEDIVCCHSARNLPATDKDMNSDDNLRAQMAHLHRGYVSRQARSLDATYDEIEAVGQASLYGSVHVLRLRDLPVIVDKFGPPRRAFVVQNLVRHPVSLVWSGYGQFRTLFRYDLNELHWTSGKVLRDAREFVFELALKHDLYIGDLENLAFLGAAAVLGSLRLDLDALSRVPTLPGLTFAGHVKMEDITQRPEALQASIDVLSGGTVPVSEAYLDRVYATGVVNAHRADSNKTDAAERYERFLPWQKEAFAHFLGLHRLRSDYESMGYDFSFL